MVYLGSICINTLHEGDNDDDSNNNNNADHGGGGHGGDDNKTKENNNNCDHFVQSVTLTHCKYSEYEKQCLMKCVTIHSGKCENY
jgi:uncharacterized sporulation protein YeaH/YhbH (DUF444 family)